MKPSNSIQTNNWFALVCISAIIGYFMLLYIDLRPGRADKIGNAPM